MCSTSNTAPEPETPTGVNTIKVNVKAKNGKLLENGRVVIMKNGVKYTTAGTIIK